MKLYISGSSHELETCSAYMARCREAGITITHDWCEAIRKAGKTDRELTLEQSFKYAVEDLRGIDACDVFWLLIPTTLTKGAWIEFGYALRGMSPQEEMAGWHNKAIVVSGDLQSSIFLSPVSHRFRTHEEAFEQIKKWV